MKMAIVEVDLNHSDQAQLLWLSVNCLSNKYVNSSVAYHIISSSAEFLCFNFMACRALCNWFINH